MYYHTSSSQSQCCIKYYYYYKYNPEGVGKKVIEKKKRRYRLQFMQSRLANCDVELKENIEALHQ